MATSMIIAKMLHLISLSMVFGGALTSFLITKKYRNDEGAAKGAFVASHMLAAPGLLILIITGLWQSSLAAFAHFKGAGYMHAKMVLIILVVIGIAMDIRGQGVMRRNTSHDHHVERAGLLKRIWGSGLATLCMLLIITLISFKPF